MISKHVGNKIRPWYKRLEKVTVRLHFFFYYTINEGK
jgi:hypothetical protein